MNRDFTDLYDSPDVKRMIALSYQENQCNPINHGSDNSFTQIIVCCLL